MKWAADGCPFFCQDPFFIQSSARRIVPGKDALAAGASWELIAPKIGGAKASDDSLIEADQMIDGGPSVLYGAVALLPAATGVKDLLKESSARDFVADAFAHCKFIGYVEAATPLFEKAGIADALDEGVIELKNRKDVAGFIETLRALRLWTRERAVKKAMIPLDDKTMREVDTKRDADLTP